MVNENKILSMLVSFQNRFEDMKKSANREGKWLKSYSTMVLNFLDLVDQLPIKSYSKDTNLAFEIHNTALKMIDIGDLFGAIDVFERISARCLAAKNFYQAAYAFNAIGGTYNKLNLFDKAEVSFGWALRIFKNNLKDNLGAIFTLNNYAKSLLRSDKKEEAEGKFIEILAKSSLFSESVVKKQHSMSKADFIASLHHNLGKLYLSLAGESKHNEKPFQKLALKSFDHLKKSISLFEDPTLRCEAESTYCGSILCLGRTLEAKNHLLQLEKKCAQDANLRRCFASIYRRLAIISTEDQNIDTAISYCVKSLEKSLIYSNPSEELDVIETFLHLSQYLANDLLSNVDDELERVKIISIKGTALIDNLVNFLEKKDLYTGLNHSFNVCQLSLRMGEIILEDPASFQLPTGQRSTFDSGEDVIEPEVLNVAGMLHDIGKLHIPWSVINKILPLREEEWILIKQHPLNGLHILDSLSLQKVGRVVVEHHEKVDGSGYPRGATRLSLMGSILALADVYEAMTTINRLYRKAKPQDVAVRELNKLSGIHYDPRAIKALSKIFT